MVISAFIGLIGLGPASRVLPARSYLFKLQPHKVYQNASYDLVFQQIIIYQS